MGHTESKLCSSCDKPLKLRQKIDTCIVCKKFVCTDCSNRETKDDEQIRICHVCKLSFERRKTLQEKHSSALADDDEGFDFGKPKMAEKKLSVKFDAAKGQYEGLPKMWREILEMPSEVSKDELEDTSDWDISIAPTMPSKRLLFAI